MDKDFRIWVELASKKRKCQRCAAAINKGTMHVLMGSREKARSQACMCAPCFESVMSDLSDEFQGMKEMTRPLVSAAEESATPLDGPRCFGCGRAPEKCRCAWEAYR